MTFLRFGGVLIRCKEEDRIKRKKKKTEKDPNCKKALNRKRVQKCLPPSLNVLPCHACIRWTYPGAEQEQIGPGSDFRFFLLALYFSFFASTMSSKGPKNPLPQCHWRQSQFDIQMKRLERVSFLVQTHTHSHILSTRKRRNPGVVECAYFASWPKKVAPERRALVPSMPCKGANFGALWADCIQ